MSKPRIGLFTYAIDHRPAKGTAIVARKYTESLLSRQNEFEVTLLHFDSCSDPIYQRGAREVIFPTFRWRWLNRRFIRMMYYFLTTRDRYEVMHWFQPRLYPFFWFAPTRRILVTIHGGGDITAPHAFLLSRTVFNWCVRLGRRWIDRGIAVSVFAKQEILDVYHLASSQVVVIPNGVDAMFFQMTSAEERERVQKKYQLPARFLLNTGRHIPHKNVPRTLRAFEWAATHGLSADVSCVQVGTGGDERVLVEQLLRESPVKDRMQHIEFIEEADLPIVYQLAEALLFPSLNEGQGMPVLEAMASGTPVVTSNTTSLLEIGQGAALLVDPMNVEEIGRAIVTVTQDQDVRTTLRKAGRERAQAFSWEQATQLLYTVYQDLLRL